MYRGRARRRGRFQISEFGLNKGDLAHVDCDQQRLFHKLVIAFVGIHPTLGRHYDALHITVVRGVVEPGGTAKNVDRVVMTAQQSIGSEAGDLFPCVALHVIWEGHLQASPGFSLDLNRRDFLRGESFMGVEERSVEVRPQCLTSEVSHVNVVPRRFSLLSYERLLWVVASLNESSVRRFDHNAVRLENRSLVLAGEVHCEALSPRFRGQYYILKKVSLALDVPDPARDGCHNFNRLNLVPTIKTAVCFDSQIQ